MGPPYSPPCSTPPEPPAPGLAAGSSGGHSIEVVTGTVPQYAERCGDGGLSQSNHGRNGNTDIGIEVGRCRFEIVMRREIEFNVDETGVERLGPRAYFELDETVGSDRRRIEITPGADGKPEYKLSGLLIQFARSPALDKELQGAFMEALDSVGSQHERERVLAALWY